MTIKLFIRPIPPVDEQPERLDWALYSYGGERIGAGTATADELKDIVSQHALEDVWVHFIVPASDFSYCVANIPAKQSRYVRQALPYAIEENVAEDIESMHLVLGTKLSREEYPVMLISDARMQEWYDLAKGIGFPLYGIYVDAQLAATEGAAITVVFDGADVLVYEKGQTVLRMHHQNLPPFLELRGQTTEEELTLKVLIEQKERETYQVILAQLEHIDNILPTIETHELSTFELLCASYFVNQDLDNVCQGDFAPNTTRSSSGIKRWWPVAAVACAWFVIQIGFDLTQAYIYKNQAGEYREQSLALYKRMFPGERTVANPKRQLEGKLTNAANSQSGAGFLSLLGEAGYQVSLQPQKANMAFNNLQYSDQRGELAIEVRAPSLDDLDRYKQALVQQGYEVGIGSAIREQGYVRGKLTIKGGS
ncbi:type II secretory pathway subunit pull [Hahella sp. CCB-MM4]|uniref:type II secretion system protein GspL n=1 Tax=Hahella sp. (strain CCB-MM4) TaxID=1926491 RepID=UPI000B9BBBC6|nr:type II secretion system protein GspL [Hahella sp. CCB-MM4]OZG73368.1 type II secretory pathway subunit pull [Hahella sp. CCB-MM4]